MGENHFFGWGDLRGLLNGMIVSNWGYFKEMNKSIHLLNTVIVVERRSKTWARTFVPTSYQIHFKIAG